MRELRPSERRLVALGLLALAAALAWLLVAGPLLGGFSDRSARRREADELYARNTRLIAGLPALRATAEEQQRFAPRFGITAPGDAQALEALKERVQRLARDEGFTVSALEDLRADARPGSVKLRVDLTLTLNQLYETLRRLQSEDAYVVIDYLSVTADRSLAAGRLAPLDVRLELSCAWRAGGAAGPGVRAGA